MLDLDLIERTLEAMPRIPSLPAYFEDMRLLIDEVRKLRAELKWLRMATGQQQEIEVIEDREG